MPKLVYNLLCQATNIGFSRKRSEILGFCITIQCWGSSNLEWLMSAPSWKDRQKHNKSQEKELLFLRWKVMAMGKFETIPPTTRVALENIHPLLDAMEADYRHIYQTVTIRGEKMKVVNWNREYYTDWSDDNVIRKPPSLCWRTNEDQVGHPCNQPT